LCRRHALPGGDEVVELCQELLDSLRDVACGGVTLLDARGHLSLCFGQPLRARHRLAFLFESLFELLDRTLRDRDVACRFGLAAFEIFDRFMALAQPRACAFELLLERGQRRT
jgi:hypothetical protein